MRKNITYFFILLVFACHTKTQEMNYKTIGTIEKSDPGLDSIISPDAKAEIIAEGFDWSEGPVWIESHKMLLFSDVPQNIVYKWTEEKTGPNNVRSGGHTEVYLKPSGYTGDTPSLSKEPGSNGLLIDKNGRLVLCQHGNRQIAWMDAPVDKPEARYISIANRYNSKRFNSPNDAVFNTAGELFFTDPPYGLQTQDDSDPAKELPFNGVYKVKTNGEVVLLTDSITRPNGIAFLPGEKKLLVANSDPAKPNWYVFDVNGDSLSNGIIFYSAIKDKSMKGLPDGFKVDKRGTVIASGPGGVYFFNSEGKLLGKLKLENATSNIALSPDEKTIYITNDMYVLRLKMRD